MNARGTINALFAFAVAAMPLAARAAGETPVPAPAIETVGGTTIVQQADARMPLVGVEVVVRAGLDRQTLKQNGLAALVAAAIVHTPVARTAGETPEPLDQAIAANGGSVRVNVDPDDVRFYVESLSTDAPTAVDLFRRALAAPDFRPATMRAARASLMTQIAASQAYALQVGIDMLNAASSSQANAGMPSLGTPASLAQLTSADAASFYRTYYRRGGSYVSAVGRLDTLDANALRTLAEALAEGSTAPVNVHVRPLQGSSREIVTHRDIASPWLIAQYAAPGIDSRDFGPMLVLAAFVKRTLSDIAQVPGVVSETFASRAVGTVYSYDRSPARLVLYVNGGIGNPSRAFATALSVVNVLAATRLEGSIDQFKALAAGDFATSATTLETRAWLATVFARESTSPDYLDRALRAIAATTPEDVQRVAKTYMGKPTIALVLPRSGSLQN
ncbi:MAG TPA: insulinase family protein [Candidatus Baltobacteraceae bacterium]|nr:insulinase family protein [Candidatus Baltobacteraceae bacterium]